MSQDRVRAFMRELGRLATAPGRVYFTGGATSVLFGWRNSTLDVDISLSADAEHLLRAVPAIKESLRMNVELASPAEFIPELPGWESRSLFIDRAGMVDFLHYDPYSQALAKLERAHQIDRRDVDEMTARGLVDPERALALFERIEPQLYRYPAIDPAGFGDRVREAFGGR